MAIFASEQQLYDVLQSVFERVSAEPEKIAPFTSSNLVIRLILTGLTPRCCWMVVSHP